MNTQEKALSGGGSRQGHEYSQALKHNYSITPSQCRALTVLYRQNCTVANLRQVVGCNNVPDLIAGLRRYGLLIPCEWVRHTDRDGKKGKHGLYSLSHPTA